MATLLPLPETTWLDANGTPLAGGSVAFYVPGTLTFKATYQDAGGINSNTNPITLDSAGRAIVYGSGSYRQIVLDSGGNLIWDQVTADTAIGGVAAGGTSTGTPNAQVVAASTFSQQNEQQIVFIVGDGLTNTGPTTVAPGGGSGIPVLKDTAAGPTALTGGELVAGNAYTLTYDTARGAFHTSATPQSTPTTFADNVFRIFDDGDNTKKIAFEAASITTGNTRTFTAPDASGTLLLNTTTTVFGGGRLALSSSTVVKLSPFMGNLVSFPAAAAATIPSIGYSSTITSAYVNGTSGQTLSASTLYYAYLWNQGSAGSPNYVIDWSTTGHSTDSTTGIEVKTGDATRVLVGAAYPTSGPVFQDGVAARLVASWFHRRPKQMANTFTADRATSSSSYVELNTEIRSLFISWGDPISAWFAGAATETAASQNQSGPSVDGGTTAGNFPTTMNLSSNQSNMASGGAISASEGFHYLTLMARVGSGTGTWLGAGSIGSSGSSMLSGIVVN